MDVIETIYARQSTRDYLPDLPPDEAIGALIDAAIRAPNAVNRQAWRFTVISNRRRLDEIAAGAKSFMTARRPLALPETLYAKLADPEFPLFYRAPVLIVISATQTGPWIDVDCALAAGTLMLAATAKGLGSCWIGLAQPFLETDAGRALAGLAPQTHPVAPIIIGFPRAGATAPSERRPPVIDRIQ
jgi:nitroreductase